METFLYIPKHIIITNYKCTHTLKENTFCLCSVEYSRRVFVVSLSCEASPLVNVQVCNMITGRGKPCETLN